MKKQAAVGLSCAALALTMAVPLSASAGGATQAGVDAYDNCTALNRDYSHGVSDRKKPRSWWIRNGATGKGAYKPNLYRSVKNDMDRDGDHIACEQ